MYEKIVIPLTIGMLGYEYDTDGAKPKRPFSSLDSQIPSQSIGSLWVSSPDW